MLESSSLPLSASENATVTLFVKSQFSSSERRFQRTDTVLALKRKLEMITGRVTSLSLDGIPLLEDEKMLGFYSPRDFQTLQVIVQKEINFNEVEKVEKIEMSQKDYEARTDSVRHFKKMNKLGRFAPPKSAEEEEMIQNAFKEEAASISVGDRCIVSRGVDDTDMEGGSGGGGAFEKRGTVLFVGKTDFKPGYWVGLRYDEPSPLRHEGTVKGKRYFECPDKFGGFVRPDLVKVGDYPEVDIMDELDMDEDEF